MAKDRKLGPDETVDMGPFKYIGYDEEKSKEKKQTYWRLQCHCGKIFSVFCGNFIRLKYRSCGCDRKKTGKGSRTFKGHEGIPSVMWSHMRYSAEKRKIEFAITIEYAWELYLKQDKKCALTGLDIEFPKTYKKKKDKNLMLASLDRKDSNLGYVPGNVQWVYSKINYMKYTNTNDEFIELCELVYKHNLSKSVE